VAVAVDVVAELENPRSMGKSHLARQSRAILKLTGKKCEKKGLAEAVEIDLRMHLHGSVVPLG